MDSMSITHYRYHVNEKFTPHSQLTRVNENPYLWSSYAVKLSGSAAPAVEADKTMNVPSPGSIRNVQVSYIVITHKHTGPKTDATMSTATETAASSTSSISNTHNNKDVNDLQQINHRLA
jgi:hypothetical protein